MFPVFLCQMSYFRFNAENGPRSRLRQSDQVGGTWFRVIRPLFVGHTHHHPQHTFPQRRTTRPSGHFPCQVIGQGPRGYSRLRPCHRPGLMMHTPPEADATSCPSQHSTSPIPHSPSNPRPAFRHRRRAGGAPSLPTMSSSTTPPSILPPTMGP